MTDMVNVVVYWDVEEPGHAVLGLEEVTDEEEGSNSIYVALSSEEVETLCEKLKAAIAGDLALSGGNYEQ